MHFIGSFSIMDNIVIGDPYAGKVLAEYVALSEHNQKTFEIQSQSGTWYAYHFYGDKKHPIALILFEEEYHFSKDINQISRNNLTMVGTLVSSFGHMIAAVDKNIANNTLYTYFTPTENIIYRIKDVKTWLSIEKLDEEKKIRQLLNKLEKKGEKYIDSSLLVPFHPTQHIQIESDIWASDCYLRLKNNPIKASVIMGGIVANTYSDENTVFIDSPKDCRVIYISLDDNAFNTPKLTIVQ